MASAGRFVGGVGCAIALALVLGACGGGNKVSATALEPRLLPATSLPGFQAVATRNWSNPVDLAAQGVDLPQPTYPSEAVKEFQNAHLKGAAGEILRTGSGTNETDITVGVAEFGSVADASKVQSWMHGQDLQQPCFGACIYSPQPLKLSGVPASTAVVATVAAAPPPKPATYLAEFTIDKYLYWAWLGADTSAQTKFEAGVRLYYEHAKKTG